MRRALSAGLKRAEHAERDAQTLAERRDAARCEVVIVKAQLDTALAERATELRAERAHIEDLNGKLAIAMTTPPESLALTNMTKDRDYWMGECAHLGKQVAALAGEIKAMVEAGAHG